MSRQQLAPDRADEKVQNKDQGMTILCYLISGIALYGGVGWVADKFLGTSFLMVIGFIAGMVISFYMIIKRYGGVA